MRNVVAGNWKSNKLLHEAREWMAVMEGWLQNNRGVDVMVAMPAPYLAACATDAPLGLHVLAQNVSAESFGAHTGEFTADMLKSSGVSGAIVGHSERRSRFGDSDSVVAAKVDALMAADLTAVFCCGETLQQRESGRAEDIVLKQLQAGILRIPVDQITQIIVAYEPVWAIGTGVTATSDEAQEMHASIRGWLLEAFGAEVAARIPLLYGGSCNPSNASELFAQKDINGGLIGGASLDPKSFQSVIQGHPALNS